jgi:hypothetical protein
VPPYRIDAADRAWFKRCRRAWDLGARARLGLEPAAGRPPPALAEAFRGALDVYYFPGMWHWDRAIVMPLVHRALDTRRPPGAPLGHALLDRYAAWAPAVDAFEPIRVAADVEVNVPDPLLTDRDLVTEDGDALVYAAHVDTVVFGVGDDRPWLLTHRFGGFAEPGFLALDEEPLAMCWAWAHHTVDWRTAGVAVNEVRLEDVEEPFRRTVVPMTVPELERAACQLGREALDMLDAGLLPYPNPTGDGCGACGFRDPCLAMRRGEDAGALLDARYRRRPTPAPPGEGQLGARTWGFGRGARPPRL